MSENRQFGCTQADFDSFTLHNAIITLFFYFCRIISALGIDSRGPFGSNCRRSIFRMAVTAAYQQRGCE